MGLYRLYMQIVGGQIMRFQRASTRPSAEVIDQFFEECTPKLATATPGRVFGFFQDVFYQHAGPVQPVIDGGGSRLRSTDDVVGRLMVDLDDQSFSCRRQSATVIEQVFDAIDYTQTPTSDSRAAIGRRDGSSSVVSAADYYSSHSELAVLYSVFR